MQLVKTSHLFISAVCVIALLMATVAAGQSTGDSKKHDTEAQSEPSMEKMKPIDMISPDDTMIKNPQTGYWTCPMHPDIHQSASGNCPICGKNLVFRKSDKYTTRMSSVDNGYIK